MPQGLVGVTAISACSSHNLALLADGTVFAWGSNYSGECDVPEGLSNVVAIAAASHTGGWGNHSLALTADGQVFAWGSNDYGQCDVPEFPAKVVAIAAGGLRSAAVLETGEVIGWPQAFTATSAIESVSLG